MVSMSDFGIAGLGNAQPSPLPPLSQEGLEAALEKEGVKLFRDDEGDIATRWEAGLTIYFLCRGDRGEILHVSSHLDRRFSLDDVPRLLVFCNEWNRDRVWPKAYVAQTGEGHDGVAQVVGELSTELGAGVAVEQLAMLVRCAAATSLQLTEELDGWAERQAL